MQTDLTVMISASPTGKELVARARTITASAATARSSRQHGGDPARSH